MWTSTNLEDIEAKGTEFNAHDIYISLNEDATEYSIFSKVNEKSIVEVKIKRVTDGFKIGENGTSLYGEDLANPWGSMRHVFWPRCAISGSLKINDVDIELDNELSMYVMAMQGMKPHHAAARWNFVNFQGPTTSLVVMNFTTPLSYGSCSVSVGAATKDDKLLYTSTDIDIHHIDAEIDEVGWPAPKKIEFEVRGPGIEASDEDVVAGKDIYKSTLNGTLEGHLVERVDVMAELPSFVKRVASGLSGAKPYIYQFSDKNMKLKLVDPEGNETEEEGHGFCETTFIS